MRNVIKSICFILILAVLLVGSFFILVPRYNLFNYKFNDFLEFEILGEKDDTIDVLFVGDSLVYSAISPMEIWNEFGYTSYDCSTPAQLTKTSYEYIKVAVERQHPKVIFLESNVLFRDPKKRKTDRKIQDFVDKYSISSRYHDNWKDLLSYGEVINANKGYVYINKTNKAPSINYMEDKHKKENIIEVNKEYFDKILDICEKNDIKLVLLGIPSMKSWNFAKSKEITKLASDYNLDFIDLNIKNHVKIDWKKETKDEGSHLNYIGAKKVSYYLGNYLKENNLVISHKDDKKYDNWNIAYNKYIRQLDFY